MKKIKLLLIFTVATVVSALAQGSQVDFNNPQFAKWGANAEEREKNMFAATFMREALDAKNYDDAAKYFIQIATSAPAASEAVYARASLLYKAKISRAKSLAEKKQMIDSLIIVHDLRLENFGDHATRGAAYILDGKARDYFNYCKNDRDGLREVFAAAIEASGDKIDRELVTLYFQCACEDYSMDLVMADFVLAEYDRLSPLYVGQDAELTARFEAAFANSGVANCENLESIFSKKLEAAPDDEKVLAQAVKLMNKAGCKTPFYTATAEKYYQVSPSSRSAMALAAIFQNNGEYDKASKYLRDALAAETDIEEQEALLARISLIELAAGRMGEALKAARKSLATADGTEADNGIALFVIAQCYGASAASCHDFESQVAYLAAYDMMQKALANFSAEEESYKKPAATMAANYKAYFPTKEECFFNEIETGAPYKVPCGAAAGSMTIIRTRD
ncbi:MAG: enzyme of heme biosynthesis [Rikenellaceae bacterium]